MQVLYSKAVAREGPGKGGSDKLVFTPVFVATIGSYMYKIGNILLALNTLISFQTMFLTQETQSDRLNFKISKSSLLPGL